MIRIVLRQQQASHLLLVRTNLGYRTILTAACTRPGCSATHYYYIIIIIIMGANSPSFVETVSVYT
jgi:hypothetical protein